MSVYQRGRRRSRWLGNFSEYVCISFILPRFFRPSVFWRAENRPVFSRIAHANALGMPWFSTKIISANYTPPQRNTSLLYRKVRIFGLWYETFRPRRFCLEFQRFLGFHVYRCVWLLFFGVECWELKNYI